VKCADGVRLMVVGLTGKQWQSLVEAIGMHDEVQRIEQARGLNLRLEGDRFKAREAIALAVQTWVGARTFSQVTQVFEQHGVCWGRYQSVEQMIEHTLPGNPMFSTVHQPGVGQYRRPHSSSIFLPWRVNLLVLRRCWGNTPSRCWWKFWA